MGTVLIKQKTVSFLVLKEIFKTVFHSILLLLFFRDCFYLWFYWICWLKL